MNPAEVVVLNSWLLVHWNEYTGYDFNVRCGKGTDPGPTYSDEARRGFILNTQKRIDVIAWKDVNATIIEVKRTAKLSAIGQIVGYKYLWQADNPTAPEPKLLMVYNQTDNDVIMTAQAAGISVEMVEADFSGLGKNSPSF